MPKNKKKINKSGKEYYQWVKQQYVGAGNAWPAPLSKLLQWANGQSMLETPRNWRELYHLDKMRRALREEYHTDPQQRRVRTNHPYIERTRGEDGEWTQVTLWGDIWTLNPEQMKVSIQTRRRQSLGEVKQIKTDMDSYNDNNKFGAQLQISFNFDKDLDELSKDTEYNPDKDKDDKDGPPSVPK